MRFEIHETVQTPDPEVVLRALEMCSREISSEVVRSGDRITIRGVGPSPRSKNKHDTTVFCVNAANNETVIQGEVNFQASALLGDTSQQDVVRSKLDDLFEQMKAQIHLDSLRIAAYAAARKSASWTAADRSEEPSTFELQESQPPEEKMASSVASETLFEVMTAAPDSGWGAPALVAEPQEVGPPDQTADSHYDHIAELREDVPTPENRLADVNSRPDKSIASAWAAESKRLAETEQAVAEQKIVDPRRAFERELFEEPTWTARIPPYRLRAEQDHNFGRKRSVIRTIAIVVLLALAGGACIAYWSKRDIFAPPASIVIRSLPAPLNPPLKPNAPKAVETFPGPTAAPTYAPADPATSNAELKRWLQSWAASMQTRDANAQAAFYADKLDRYLDQRNVGRGAVLRDREATIRMRKGLWTVKMENIVIERQTASEAEVRLMKHFIDEPEESEILESFVPTRLTLKRINGQWKITSEQDQPTISVTPWKAQGGIWLDQDKLGVRETQASTLCVYGCIS